MAVRRVAILALILPVLGFAEASGRAACRVEFGEANRVACYVEQIVWASGPIEATTGVDIRYPGGITPYSTLGLYMPGWWTVLEFGALLPTAQFRIAISAGVRW